MFYDTNDEQNNNSKSLQVYVNEKVFNQINVLAKQHNRKTSDFLRMLILNFLNKVED